MDYEIETKPSYKRFNTRCILHHAVQSALKRAIIINIAASGLLSGPRHANMAGGVRPGSIKDILT